VRVQVLTNSGALDREKQIAVVRQLTDLIANAAGDPTLSHRTWVPLTEAPQGGWGLWGHAHTNEEIVGAARAEITKLKDWMQFASGPIGGLPGTARTRRGVRLDRR
jgi:phenylpyruvate tautomerase PptA (4-oxalocrotonate tautomerase family)